MMSSQRCRDCGEPSKTPLCDECARVAAVLGFTVDERLELLEVRAQQVFDLEALA